MSGRLPSIRAQLGLVANFFVLLPGCGKYASKYALLRPPMAKRKPQSDWDMIEREYRRGLISIREIARSWGVSEGAIRKRAAVAEPPWLRNLAEQVLQATKDH
jgi:hypothetical protein